MDMFVIRGGKPLAGRVRVGGAKNSALPIMAAALLAHGQTVLRDVPDLVDVRTLAELLQSLGLRVERRPDRSLAMEVIDDRPVVAEYELVRMMRAKLLVSADVVAGELQVDKFLAASLLDELVREGMLVEQRMVGGIANYRLKGL